MEMHGKEKEQKQKQNRSLFGVYHTRNTTAFTSAPYDDLNA
jgi:hypothetical protein